MVGITPQINSLLLRLQSGGPIQVVDGDEWPVDFDVVLAAEKQKLVRYSDGGSWNCHTLIEIAPRGQRAIGINVPSTRSELFIIWLRSIFARSLKQPTASAPEQ